MTIFFFGVSLPDCFVKQEYLARKKAAGEYDNGGKCAGLLRSETLDKKTYQASPCESFPKNPTVPNSLARPECVHTYTPCSAQGTVQAPCIGHDTFSGVEERNHQVP